MPEEEKPVNKRGRPKGSRDKRPRKAREDMGFFIEPSDVSRIVAFEKQWLDLPKVDTGNREEVEKRINDYFEMCIAEGFRPGVAGLCNALGIHRSTWWDWGVGIKRDYKDIVERTKALLEAILEQYAIQGKINPVTAIFMLKNHFGYKDQSELAFIKPDPVGDKKDIESLRVKYLEQTYGMLDDVPEGELIENNIDEGDDKK